MEKTPIYSDQFLEVHPDHLVLKDYYFFRFGKKEIRFDEIQEFKEIRLTYFNGLTRHEIAWFKPRWPFDWKFKNRKEALYIKPRGHFFGIGISSENIREIADMIRPKIGNA